MKVMIIKKLKEWITKIITVLLTCVVMKTIIRNYINKIIKILIVTILKIIVTINNNNLRKTVT